MGLCIECFVEDESVSSINNDSIVVAWTAMAALKWKTSGRTPRSGIWSRYHFAWIGVLLLMAIVNSRWRRFQHHASQRLLSYNVVVRLLLGLRWRWSFKRYESKSCTCCFFFVMAGAVINIGRVLKILVHYREQAEFQWRNKTSCNICAFAVLTRASADELHV